jgi:imidazolonepropionase-like amidohydrolase
MRTSIALRALMIAAVFLAAGGAPALAGNESIIVIKAGRVHTLTGAVIEHGIVVIRDGKIAALGADALTPEGAKVIDLPEGVVTPGLIDACCVVDPEMTENNFYFRQRFSCPDCAELARRQLKASNGGASIGHDLPLCSRCRAAQSGAGSSLWVELAERARENAPAVADGTVSLNEGEHEGHSHGEGDVCAGVCGGPKTARDDASPFVSVMPSPRTTWAEHESEVVPYTRVMDSVNLFSNDFVRLLRSGVTTVFVSPDSASVIGARGAIVRTGGDLSRRVIRAVDAVKATVGADPILRGRSNFMPSGGYADIQTRRPTTRMGVDFVFRKAFYDTQRWSAGIERHGADIAPEPAFPVLKQVLGGEIPLRIQARMQHDIVTAMRLAHEFGLKFTLEEATEAYQCVPELKATGTPVIYGPIFINPRGQRDIVNEAERPVLSTPRMLLDAGIPFALTAQEMRDEESLIRQAMMASRYGLPADAALRAVTTSPAKLLGLGEEFGTLKTGADADLVVWSGDPLDAASRVRAVVIGGQLAYEN